MLPGSALVASHKKAHKAQKETMTCLVPYVLFVAKSKSGDAREHRPIDKGLAKPSLSLFLVTSAPRFAIAFALAFRTRRDCT